MTKNKENLSKTDTDKVIKLENHVFVCYFNKIPIEKQFDHLQITKKQIIIIINVFFPRVQEKKTTQS